MTAILHESAPVRFWDHDLGPDQLRLFAVDPDHVQRPRSVGRRGQEPAVAEGRRRVGRSAGRSGQFAGLRDLTPEPGRALDGQAFELTPDGTSVVTGWWQWNPAGRVA